MRRHQLREETLCSNDKRDMSICEARFAFVFLKHHLKIKESQINKHSIVAVIALGLSYGSRFASALSNGSVQSLVHLSVRRQTSTEDL